MKGVVWYFLMLFVGYYKERFTSQAIKISVKVSGSSIIAAWPHFLIQNK